jgi:phosphonate transport system substrate-binding protein
MKFGVGVFSSTEKNDATYRPLPRTSPSAWAAGRAAHGRQLGGLAKSLVNGETYLALMGPWGHVLAIHFADVRVVSTILYRGKPENFAMIVTHPNSGLNSIDDLLGPKGKGRNFAFGDNGLDLRLPDSGARVPETWHRPE